jgi:hypothetical protein
MADDNLAAAVGSGNDNAPLRLQTGQLVDAKNTLRSYTVIDVEAGRGDAVAGAANNDMALAIDDKAAAGAARMMQMPLEQQQMIDAKNTAGPMAHPAVAAAGAPTPTAHHPADRGAEQGAARKAEVPPEQQEPMAQAIFIPDASVDTPPTHVVSSTASPPTPAITENAVAAYVSLTAFLVAKLKKWGVGKVVACAIVVVVIVAVVIISLVMTRDSGGNSGNRSDAQDSAVANNAQPSAAGQGPMPSSPTIAPTTSPTSSPTTELSHRTTLLTDFINNITLSGRTIESATLTASSPVRPLPEDRALQWLIEYDPTDWSLDSEADRFKLQQRYALYTLWVQQVNASLSDPTFSDLVRTETCDWTGITCRSATANGSDIMADVVTAIEWPETGTNSKWSGQRLVPDIGLLSSGLTQFKMSYTALSGSLPDTIGEWTQLRSFNVEWNGITGTIPESVSKWTNLQSFVVQRNQLTASLPADAMTQWTDLREFDVYLNQFAPSTIPSMVGEWRNLTYFDISLNDFTGSIPDSVASWTNLEYFAATNNKLNGTLPDSIGLWTNIKVFNIAGNVGNDLTGTLPFSIGRWTKLEDIDISANTFTGTIPSSIASWTSLHELFFGLNANLTGAIPPELCVAANLTWLRHDCNGQINCTCAEALDVCGC